MLPSPKANVHDVVGTTQSAEHACVLGAKSCKGRA